MVHKHRDVFRLLRFAARSRASVRGEPDRGRRFAKPRRAGHSATDVLHGHSGCLSADQIGQKLAYDSGSRQIDGLFRGMEQEKMI